MQQLDLSGPGGLDLRIVEGNSGTAPVNLIITPTGPNLISPMSVSWRTVAGSATGGTDFVVVSSGIVNWAVGDGSAKSITAQVVGDAIQEPPGGFAMSQQDEVFFVELFGPVNATIRRGRVPITIVDNDTPQPGVQFLSAVTDSLGPLATDGRNRLQWRIPASLTALTGIIVAWTSGSSSCAPPVSDTAGEVPGPVLLSGPFTAGGTYSWTHDTSLPYGPVAVPRVYCYSVFTKYGAAVSSERAEVVTKTFDSTSGPVKWTFTAGNYGGAAAPNLVPPTVGSDGIYSVGTDGVVHAMTRGPSGGLWPPNWNPVGIGKPAHNRSPVVPLAAGGRLFVGTESGELHAIDARLGSIVWSRAASFPPGSQQLMTNSTGVQATPAGIFKSFGGLNDLLLVGTATPVGNTSFFALDPATGATVDFYPNAGAGDVAPGPIDNVYGMAVVDYANNRVYFGTAGSAFTLWSLDLGPGGAPDLTLTSIAWNPKPLGVSGGTMGSPVLRNGRLYVGTDSGAASAIHSLRVSDGNLYSYPHGDGQVKGFVWPDRRDDRLYFTTVNQIHGVRDSGTPPMTPLWSPLTVQSPSIPLQMPGTDNLYVGDGQGRLLQIDVATGLVTVPLQLDTGTVQIGAPSLDGANNLLLVGSDQGVIYAVRVPY